MNFWNGFIVRLKSDMAESLAYCYDCLDAMRQMQDKAFTLAVCDPPYGRKEHGGKCRSGYVLQKNGNRMYVSDGGYERKEWHNAVPPHEYFEELFRVSKNQIIFGCNYFVGEIFGSGRIVWGKCNGASDQSDCEIAYNSMTSRVDLFRFMWSGMMQGKSIEEGHIMQGNKALNEKRMHPTQKPVALYRWIFQHYAKPGDKILDTHLGSGSSRIAAYDAGLDFTGYEIDKDYFEKQEERFRAHTAQMSLFVGGPQ